MSQMAGWSILDYGLHYSDEPAPFVRLGYASILSSWALVNSGTPATNYGYWFPGPENDGAAGWNFQTEKFGRTWATGECARGIWPYDGEIDHGLAGGIRAAATVVMDDPIFGRIALGGLLQPDPDATRVIPRDGVRRRLHFLLGPRRVHLELATDGFAAGAPVVVDDRFHRMAFRLENRSGRAHEARLVLRGLPAGSYTVRRNGEAVARFTSAGSAPVPCRFPVPAEPTHDITVSRSRAVAE